MEDYLNSVSQVYEKIDIVIFTFFPLLNITPLSGVFFTAMMSQCFSEFSKISPKEVKFPKGLKTLISIALFLVLGFFLVFFGFYLAISDVLTQYSKVS